MAGQGELKLLGFWASPFVMRVRMALELKCLSYENVEDDIWNKSHLLLASNPVHKKVPVLIHNGMPICESMVIVQYIDEAFAGIGPSLLPSDPYERAVARFWGAFVDDKLFAGWVGYRKALTEEEKAEKLKETFAAVQHLEGAFKDCFKGKAFFGGDSIGYIDIALVSLLCWFKVEEEMAGIKLIDAGKTPLLAAWAERFGGTEAAKEVIPETGRLVEYAKIAQAKREAAATAAAAVAKRGMPAVVDSSVCMMSNRTP